MVYLQLALAIYRMVTVLTFRMEYEPVVCRAVRQYDIAVEPVAEFAGYYMMVFYLVTVFRLIIAAGPVTCIFELHALYIRKTERFPFGFLLICRTD